MITICLTYFRSLSLTNLAAALYSVLQQDFDQVKELILFDNNTWDTPRELHDLIDNLQFPIPVRLLSFKHGDLTKTHSWSTNRAVQEVTTPWVFFCRADYLLRFDMLHRCMDVLEAHSADWNGFITGNGCHLHVGIEVCEKVDAWRTYGPNVLKSLLGGVEFNYTSIDAGVWMARRDAFIGVGGLEEGLTSWGHAQTHFQWKMHKAGVEFVRIPQTLFFHPFHGGERDITLAHQQIGGIEFLREMWARYDGPQPY